MAGVVTFHDITTLKDLERAREEFLSSAVHDLKAPLTTVRGYTQLAQRSLAGRDTSDTTVALKHLARIDESARRMVSLINDMEDTTRAQKGVVLDLDRRPTDMVALVRRVVEQQQAMTMHQVHVDAAVPTLEGTLDADRVERVVANLLSNAVKYSPDGGHITVQVAREDEAAGPQAVIAVRDEGVGIPAADVPFIFERFHRAGNIEGHIKGTGIGLASVRHIVEQHSGTVSVDSQEGAGSTFTVRLPLTAV